MPGMVPISTGKNRTRHDRGDDESRDANDKQSSKHDCVLLKSWASSSRGSRDGKHQEKRSPPRRIRHSYREDEAGFLLQ